MNGWDGEDQEPRIIDRLTGVLSVSVRRADAVET
jgi:hypothetical protein